MIGIPFLSGAGILFAITSRPTQASYTMGTGAPSPGIQWLEREADHSPPSMAEVNDLLYLYLHLKALRSKAGVLNPRLTARIGYPFVFL
jgi:hypothetical protein